jgi:two-component system nitrogen regulation sensor histidine kinase NtrY
VKLSRAAMRSLLAVLVLFGVCWVVYFVLVREMRFAPGADSNQLLLTVLTMTLVFLALALAGLLIRNLVKLVVERKRGILGAQLRTKLVFFYLLLVLVPAIVLFSGSAKVIKETVEATLRFPDLTRQSSRLVDEWREAYESRSREESGRIAAELRAAGLPAPGAAAALAARLDAARARAGLERVWIVRGGEVLAAAETHPLAAAERAARLADVVAPLELRARAERAPQGSFDRLGGTLLAAHGVAPLDERTSVVTVITVPRPLAEAMGSVVVAAESYRRYRGERDDLVRLYLTLIGLIFLVVLFVATWIGFYLARRISGPILELAAASREISAGNLGIRVASVAGDELSTLVDAFNEMAGELQENRAVITRSTADLRRSNRALDERRRYIETLIEGLSVGVVSLDSAGAVTTANPAVARILALDLSPGATLSHELTRAGLDPLRRVIEQPATAPTRHDLELATAAGTRQVAVQISPLGNSAGERIGTLITVEDLTELLRAQRALTWQEVARRIAHEIKNPLTPIQLAAQRIRKKFVEGAEDLPRVLPEATASIEREVAGLKRLVDEFSRFARLPEVRLEPVELTQVVESVIALYEGVPGIEWEIELDRAIGLVALDAEQLRRALINLVDNALAAMEGRGTIRLSTRGNARQGWIRIEVADSGPGIPPGDRDRMFLPYYSTKPRGSGLGLAIVHRVFYVNSVVLGLFV